MVASRQSNRSRELIKDSRAYYCLECGKCTARCPIARVDKSFSPVFNIAQTIRGYDQEIQRNGAIWACMICEACSNACPSDVDYPRLVLGMRAEAFQSGDDRFHRQELERVFLDEGCTEGFGIFREIFAVQTSGSAYDGGVVTSLLIEGLNSDLFDAAIVVRRGYNQKTEAFIAENSEDIISAKGSKYELVPIPEKLIEAVQERGKKRIAVVGLPCQVIGIREIQRSLPDVDLTVIGLFCMENFRYHLLKSCIADILHVDLDSAEMISILKGNFIVSIGGKSASCKVKDLIAAVRTGCLFCTDFTSELADISVGTVGSPDGYSTVITRSQKGEDLCDLLKDHNGTSADCSEIARMAAWKQKNGSAQLKSLFSRGADER